MAPWLQYVGHMLNSNTNTNRNMDMNDNNETAFVAAENIQEGLDDAKKRIAALEEQLRKALARGTNDVTSQALEVTQPLSARVETALRSKPYAVDELSRFLKEPATKLLAEIKTAKQGKKIANIGTEERPRWAWKVGDQATSKELQSAVLRLIQDTPLSFAEICAATGARGGLVQGALVEIRRSGIMVHNMGTKTRARYFVMPPDVIDARLEPKLPVKKVGQK